MADFEWGQCFWIHERMVSKILGGDLMLVVVSVPALRRHSEETPQSLVCNRRGESGARVGRAKELAVATGLCTSRLLSTFPDVAFLAKGDRKAAGLEARGLPWMLKGKKHRVSLLVALAFSWLEGSYLSALPAVLLFKGWGMNHWPKRRLSVCCTLLHGVARVAHRLQNLKSAAVGRTGVPDLLDSPKEDRGDNCYFSLVTGRK